MEQILQTFTSRIINDRRNPIDNHVLELLKDSPSNPERTIQKGEHLYRGRIINSNDTIGTDESSGFDGFDKAGSFVAPPERTKDMRANYKNIPYLYCSDNRYLAVAELRPHIGSRISIATIEVKQELKIFDLTSENEVASSKKKQLLYELSELFSKPVDSGDNTNDYIPTQYIAEFIRFIGYDGLAYKSAFNKMTDLGISEKSNIVVFSYNKCEAINSSIYKVDNIDIEIIAEKEKSEVKISSPINEVLSQI